MTDQEAMALLREVVNVGPLPTDEPETHPLMEHCLKALEELKRYREREPLVQALVQQAVYSADILASEGAQHTANTLAVDAKAVDDFTLLRSAEEGRHAIA